MSPFNHYIPESEAKARSGCFGFLAAIFFIPLILTIAYNIFVEIVFDGMLIIGLMVTLVGVILLAQKKMIERKGFKLKARIVDFKPVYGSINGDTQHDLVYPIVKFLSQKGAMKSGQVENSYTIGKYNLGDELSLIIFGDKIYSYQGISKRNILITSLGILIVIFDLAWWQ